ncbi:MAG: hypothetical protein Q7T03_10000 [Deltaproteobacteria bacterium]|nr:hypothetical protein [Deltaproteobacteria bacterium]
MTGEVLNMGMGCLAGTFLAGAGQLIDTTSQDTIIPSADLALFEQAARGVLVELYTLGTHEGLLENLVAQADRWRSMVDGYSHNPAHQRHVTLALDLRFLSVDAAHFQVASALVRAKGLAAYDSSLSIREQVYAPSVVSPSRIFEDLQAEPPSVEDVGTRIDDTRQFSFE